MTLKPTDSTVTELTAVILQATAVTVLSSETKTTLAFGQLTTGEDVGQLRVMGICARF
jgi:hypothetical protein